MEENVENIKNHDEEHGIHVHCFTCYKMSCDVIDHCNIIDCPNYCGLRYHQCKNEEHMCVCTRTKRACINQYFGCPFLLDSIGLMKHLEYCPASVIHCGMSWNRYPLYSKIREEWLPFWQANPVLVKGDLDTEFAISDQFRVNQEMKRRIKRGQTSLKQKKSVSKIPPIRTETLEKLMNGGKKNKELSKYDSKDLKDDSSFFTYDDVHFRLMDASGFVFNTNIRHGYFELPYKYSYRKVFDIITDEESTSTGMTSLKITVSETDMKVRNETYAALDRIYFPLGLNVIVETMPKFQNQYPMYSFSCSKVFRRDQYTWHFKNIHQDIQPHVNGWLFQRCPLSQYGCPYSQYKLKPENLKIRYSAAFSSFYGQYDKITGPGAVVRNDDIGFFDLPEEVLDYLFTFMDSLTFNNLAKTCTYLRNVCYNFLDTRGIVLTTWAKRDYNELGSAWKEDCQIRLFTTSCAPMGELTFTNSPPIGNHLKSCPFNTRNHELYERKKVPLLPKDACEKINKRRK